MMITIILIVGLILTFLFLKKKRNMERQGKTKQLSYHFSKYSLEFLIPFVIVAFLYSIIPFIMAIASDTLNLQSLIQLEEFLEKLKSSLAIFKLSAIQVFILLIVIFLLGLLRLPSGKTKKFFKMFDKYKVLTRRIFIVLFLLCSFTFFGTHLGEPISEVKLRIKTIRDGYAEINKEVDEAISEEVAAQVYEKAQNSFPPSYGDALKLPEKIGSQINSLHGYYSSAQNEYGIKAQYVQSILRANSSRNKITSSLDHHIKFTKTAEKIKVYPTSPNPRTINSRKIKGTITTLKQYRNRLSSRAITLLQTEAGKKVTSQVPKILTSEIRTALFRQWIEAYPILEPIIDAFKNALNKEIETKVENVIERTSNSLIQNSSNIEEIINAEASKIVDQQKIKIPRETLQKANQARKQLERQFANIEKARAQLGRQIRDVNNKTITRLIKQLRSPNEDVRIKAADRLSNMGNKLSKSHVNRLVNIMKNGRKTWSKFLYRESHCKWFQDTTEKYYAGRALEDMRSQYVTSEITREARKAQNNGKTRRRVTDPGWICY